LSTMPNPYKRVDPHLSHRERSSRDEMGRKHHPTRRKDFTPEGNSSSTKEQSYINEDMVKHMIDSIDRDFNNELDFEEFYILFSNSIRI
jgi:hypothetical protein